MEVRSIKKINTNPVVVDFVILALCFCLSILVVNPFGDFPLNDDWSFAITVKRLVEIGLYVPNGWGAMTQVTNIGWGSLFCLPFGFSFNALRVSTLTASIIGVFGVYLCARELGLPRSYRIIASLTLAFNPIYFALSHTFMTDILFAVLQTLSALFFLRCLKNDSSLSLGVGIGMAVAATLSRQLGIAIPLAFAVVYIFRHGMSTRNVIRAALPLIICIGALALFQQWLAGTGRLSAAYTRQNATFLSVLLYPQQLLMSEAINAYVAFLYFGLFLLPSLLFLLPAIWQEHTRRNINIWLSVVFVGGVTSVFVLYIAEPSLPMLGNILDKFGIGPLTLKDTYILNMNNLPELPHEFWSMMTWLGVFGATLIAAAVTFCVKKTYVELRLRKTTVDSASSLFLFLSAIAYLFPIFTSAVFDRYLVPVIPLLMLGCMNQFSKVNFLHDRFFRVAGFVLVIAFSLFSICTTRDYLTWNRTRWQALNDLTQTQRIAVEDIDGGFEFNGFYLYDHSYRPRPNKSWWWVQEDTYLIGFQSVLGYNTVKEYTYSHWLPPYVGQIIVQKK